MLDFNFPYISQLFSFEKLQKGKLFHFSVTVRTQRHAAVHHLVYITAWCEPRSELSHEYSQRIENLLHVGNFQILFVQI